MSWRLVIGIGCAFAVFGSRDAAAQREPIQPTSAVQPPVRRVAGETHPLVRPIQIGERSLAAANELQDYTATLYRKMWLGTKYSESSVRMKFRTRPFSVYLFFVQPKAGREVLYVDGWNNNQMYAHEGSGPLSFFGSISLDPTGSQAMDGSKYPITRIGVANLAKSVVGQWTEEMRFTNAADVTVKLYPDATLQEFPCKVVETTHSRPIRGLTFHKTRLFLTRDANIPFAVQQFGFPQQPGVAAPKLEDVRYQNLKTNVGLTASDFDPRNPAYKF